MMTLLREWAHKAQKQGLEGLMIQQILKDEAFEEAALEAVRPKARGLRNVHMLEDSHGDGAVSGFSEDRHRHARRLAQPVSGTRE
jgi:hypothetical protein